MSSFCGSGVWAGLAGFPASQATIKISDEAIIIVNLNWEGISFQVDSHGVGRIRFRTGLLAGGLLQSLPRGAAGFIIGCKLRRQ